MSGANDDASFQTQCRTQQQVLRQFKLLFTKPPTRYDITTGPYGDLAAADAQYKLNMQRKLEILRYRKGGGGGGGQNRPTRAQKYAQAMRGVAQEVSQTRTVCPDGTPIPDPKTRASLSTAAALPGPAIWMQYDATVPLYMYNTTNTYAIENTADDGDWDFVSTPDMIGLNEVALTTLGIKQMSEGTLGNFTLTTSVAFFIRGYAANGSASSLGTFSFQLSNAQDQLHLQFLYGTQALTFPDDWAPRNAFLDGFLNTVYGQVAFDDAHAGTPQYFEATVFLGNIEVRNILLSTAPGYMYVVQGNAYPVFLQSYLSSGDNGEGGLSSSLEYGLVWNCQESVTNEVNGRIHCTPNLRLSSTSPDFSDSGNVLQPPLETSASGQVIGIQVTKSSFSSS